MISNAIDFLLGIPWYVYVLSVLLFIGSVPLVLMYYVMAAGLGIALKEFPDHNKFGFMAGPTPLGATP